METETYLYDGKHICAIASHSVQLQDKGDFFELLHTAIELAEVKSCCNNRDIVYTSDYVVLTSDTEVLACSKIGIPFQPNTQQLKLRELLKAKLKALRPEGEGIFFAQYGSAAHQISDIENALFYNMGTATFNDIVGKETSVCFQRLHPSEIACCENREYQYLFHYRWIPNEIRRNLWEKELICEWSDIPLGKVNTTSKARDYFLAIKQSPDSVRFFRNGSNGALGIRIQLSVPRNARFKNAVCVMKPMIDGVICAFHDFLEPDKIEIETVSCRLNINKEMLLSSEKTCLGKQCYVRAHPRYVKWYPQDERLNYVVIEPRFVDDEMFSFRGKIFAVPD